MKSIAGDGQNLPPLGDNDSCVCVCVCVPARGQNLLPLGDDDSCVCVCVCVCVCERARTLNHSVMLDSLQPHGR